MATQIKETDSCATAPSQTLAVANNPPDQLTSQGPVFIVSFQILDALVFQTEWSFPLQVSMPYSLQPPTSLQYLGTKIIPQHFSCWSFEVVYSGILLIKSRPPLLYSVIVSLFRLPLFYHLNTQIRRGSFLDHLYQDEEAILRSDRRRLISGSR